MRYQWGFSMAGEIVFGLNAAQRIAQKVKMLNGDNALIFTDPGVISAGLLEYILVPLRNAGIKYETFENGEPEPSIRVVEKAAEWARSKKYEVLIGMGGGSVIDLMKAVSILITYGGSVDQYFGEGKVPGFPCPMIAIPTTAGTGSSVSPAAVLTDEDENLKKGIADNKLRPSVAIVDPLLTISCPAALTAATGIDVLAHAVESYLAKPFAYLETTAQEEETILYHGSNPMADGLARDAIKLVGKSLRIAVDQGSNVEARMDMALANIKAGLAFSNAGVTAVHAMAYPLGAYSHASHGVVNGLLLPHVLEYNIPVCSARLKEVASWLGENTKSLNDREAAYKAVQNIKQLIEDIGLPSKMSQIGINKDQVKPMAEATLKVTRLLRGNPRKIDAQDIEAIFYKAL